MADAKVSAGTYIIIANGSEIKIESPLPMTCQALKGYLQEHGHVAPSTTRFVLVDVATKKKLHASGKVRFGTFTIEVVPPPAVPRFEMHAGSYQAEDAHLKAAKCHIDHLQVEAVLFLDTPTVLKLVESKEHYSAFLNNPGYVFVVTESVDSETRQILAKTREDRSWKETFARGRLFLLRSGVNKTRKDLTATALLKLPPYGGKFSTWTNARVFLEACACYSQLQVQAPGIIVSDDNDLVIKCNSNPVWLKDICAAVGARDKLPLRRFRSADPQEKPLGDHEPGNHDSDLLFPYQTLGVIGPRGEFVPHPTFDKAWSESPAPPRIYESPSPASLPPFDVYGSRAMIPAYAQASPYGPSPYVYAPPFMAAFPPRHASFFPHHDIHR